MYDPTDRIDLPYRTVRERFHQTCLSVGCPEVDAMTIGQSVWHLCNRGLDGVDYALRYLATYRPVPEMTGSVAFLAVEMSEKLNSGARRTSAFLGISAPLLLLPAASFRLDENAETDGILFTFDDQTVVYSTTHGLRILSINPQGLMQVDPSHIPTCTASRVDFADGSDQDIIFHRQKLETLAVPRAVLRDDANAFDLSAIA